MQRSSSITLLALFVIVTSAGSTLLFAAQNVMLHLLVDLRDLPLAAPEVVSRLPPSIAFLLGHLYLLMAAMLALSVVALLSGIGLLLRINLARVVFIGLLLVGVAWNLGMLWLQHRSTGSMAEIAREAGAPAGDAAVLSALGVAALVSVLLSLLCLWLVRWLSSEPVRREFGQWR